MWIRSETGADHAAIHRVVEAAFAGAAHASGTEARIVDALRETDALSLSLVADTDGRIAGHAALSPVPPEDGAHGWYGLGPVAVDPCDQGHRVGSALVRAALAELSRMEAAGCVVLGDPPYYARFGFRARASLHYPGAPAGCFMALPLGDAVPRGSVAYPSAFSAA